MNTINIMKAASTMVGLTREVQFAAHYFTNLESAGFSPEDYSRLKFGSDEVAKKFGYELAEKFFKEFKDKILDEQLVVIPSPYNQVKNASTIMSEHFMDRLNVLLVENGGNHVEWNTISRKVSYINDYGFLPAEERKKLIDGDTFHMNKGFLEGKTLIFIDDVYITGTHERKLQQVLQENEVYNNRYFLYFAQYDAKDVSPEIEAELNFSAVKSLGDYLLISLEEGHHLIVRPIKYLLSRTETEFSWFAQVANKALLKKIYHGALAEGYYNIDAYKTNLSILRSALQEV